MREIWADIYGYDGKYQVSTWGRVRNISGIMKPFKTDKGYLRITLYDGKCYKKHRVNRLVAETFIPNWSNLPEVNHKDGNKENNSITNLEWVSGTVNREHDRNEELNHFYNAECIRRYRAAMEPYHFPDESEGINE